MRCATIVCTLFLLLLLACGGNNTAGTTSETDIGIVGTLVDEAGDVVVGARVIAFLMEDTQQGMPVDTVLTDEYGKYKFIDLSSGSYSFEALLQDAGSELKVIISTIDFDAANFADSALVLGVDTLVATGSVEGVVELESGETASVDIFIPGTSLYGSCTDAGSFEISDIPKGDAYTIRFHKEGYIPKDTTGIKVMAGKTTTFQEPIVLVIDRTTIVEPPVGLEAVWDSVTSTVTLSWDAITHPNLDGYQVYRKDSSQSSDTMELISKDGAVPSNSFVDTVPPLKLGESVTYTYMLKSQNREEELGDFSDSYYVQITGNKYMLPIAVSITTPVDGDQNAPTPTIFRWTSAGEGVTYELLIWRDVINDTLTFETTKTNFSPNSLPNGGYKARVKSINEKGSTLGPIISFRIENGMTYGIIGSDEDVWDTFIAGGVSGKSSPYTDKNYGALEWMTVGEHDSQTAARGLLYFDPKRLPSKKVNSAKLLLTVSNWVDHSHENSGPMTIAVHKVLKPWREGDTAPVENLHINSHKIILDGVHNSESINAVSARESTCGSEWNAPMLALDGKDARKLFEDTTTHAMSDGVDFAWEFDITELVNEWISSPETNFGLLLKPLTEDYAGAEVSFPIFYTWEQRESSKPGPQLILE